MELKTGYQAEAIKKLQAQNITGRKEKAMADAVRQQLEAFVDQDEEFAQAVAQGGTFAACMQAVAANTGSCISDLEAYRKAVQFYFPGAEIRVQMTIDLIGAAGDPKDQQEEAAGPMILQLEDFFG